MGILGLSKTWLGKTLSTRSLLGAMGGLATERFIVHRRTQWERAKEAREDALLESLSSYELARGAGKLLAGLIAWERPKRSLMETETALQRLLRQMDPDDALPEEKARSRFLVSKVLFGLEGFKWSACRYEPYQQESLALMRKNPRYKHITRSEVFRGECFLPEELIATTHRMLLTLDEGDGQLMPYLKQVVQDGPLKTEADYMSLLVALTVCADPQDDEALSETINAWFAAYCDFKIEESHQREAWVQTSIQTATGALPAQVGWDLLGRVGKAVFKQKRSSSTAPGKR